MHPRFIAACTPRQAAAAPVITSISPRYSVIAGGVTVTLTGTGFTNGMTVVDSDGNGNWTQVAFTSSTSATFQPAGDGGMGEGIVDVTASNGNGTTLTPNLFVYTAETAVATIAVAGISPASGTSAGDTSITVTGAHFIIDNGVFTTVTLDTTGTPAVCTNVSVVDATTISCRTAAHVTGLVNARVNTVIGTGTVRAAAYTYT